MHTYKLTKINNKETSSTKISLKICCRKEKVKLVVVSVTCVPECRHAEAF